MVLLEPPILEAEAALKFMDDHDSMTGAECDAAQRFRERLRQAIAVERGAGGSEAQPEGGMEEIAKALIGQRVRVATFHGSVKTGVLRRLSGFRTVIVEDGEYRHPVNLSLVKSIEVARETGVAA